MNDNNMIEQDLLHWMPIPFATGSWMREADGNLVGVTDIELTVGLANGDSVTVRLVERGGGWRLS